MGVPQGYTAGTGCWRAVQAGRPTYADADARSRRARLSVPPPPGPGQPRALAKPFRTVLDYHRPAANHLHASVYGYRGPQTRS